MKAKKLYFLTLVFFPFYRSAKNSFIFKILKNLDNYSLKKYDFSEDINKSVLFYGVYRETDINQIKNHKGSIFIYWDDNDANVNYENRRNNLLNISKLAKVNICSTNIVEKYLQIVNIKYKKIRF